LTMSAAGAPAKCEILALIFFEVNYISPYLLLSVLTNSASKIES
jgi:hypothetical protein